MCEKALRTELENIIEAAPSDGAASMILIECTSTTPLWWLGPLIWSIGVTVAAISVFMASKIARHRATLDFIEKFEATPHYRDMRSEFEYLFKEGLLTQLANPKDTARKQQRTAVLDYLNHYEIVSIGIIEKSFDKAIYGDWMRGRFIRDWNRARDFIQRERWQYDTDKGEWVYYDRVYQKFEQVVRDYDPGQAKLTKDSSPPPETYNKKAPADELTPNPG